ncbi:MAG: pentapeptide repeat-containing protein [Actinomycetes bacterium]
MRRASLRRASLRRASLRGASLAGARRDDRFRAHFSSLRGARHTLESSGKAGTTWRWRRASPIPSPCGSRWPAAGAR